jgi:effector-binding domain-containing protein
MKIIKYVFLLILLAFIALAVFIATQEAKYDIRKERIINVPQPLLYEYLNDHRNWENVGILTNNDTTAVYAYTDITSGKGAVSTWKHDDISGRIETVKVVENDSIIQKAVINDLPSDIRWGFQKVPGGTKVSFRMKGSLSFYDKANAVFKGGVTEKLEEKIDNGLAGLNNFLTHELKTFSVEEIGMTRRVGTFYLSQTVTGSISEMSRKVADILPKLRAFVKENKIATNGNPFTLYKMYNKVSDSATYSVCIPIKEEIFTSPGSDIEGGTLEPFNAFKVTLKGYYSHLPKAWDKAHTVVAEKGLFENPAGQYIEVYTRGINQTKKPSQWTTDLYIPVGNQAVPVPVQGEVQAATSATSLSSTAITKPAVTTTKPAAIAPVKPKPATTGTTTPAKPKTTTISGTGTTQRRADPMEEFNK